MADDRAVSARYVREVILADLDRQNGHFGNWTVENRPIKGRDSWIFRADGPQAPFPLALKRCLACFASFVTALYVVDRAVDERRSTC